MSHKRKVLQGSASNMVRVVLSMLVSLVLPPFLVHHMPTVEYSAWVLILQLSAYVALLDFGLQTAIGKFVAEYDANDDRESSRRLVSTSFTILAAASAIACLAVCAMAYSVPHLFHQMPPALVPEVRIALLAIGFVDLGRATFFVVSIDILRLAAVCVSHGADDFHAGGFRGIAHRSSDDSREPGAIGVGDGRIQPGHCCHTIPGLAPAGEAARRFFVFAV